MTAVAAAGPFFALGTAATGPGWLGFDRLVDAGGARDRVVAARASLAERAGLPVERIEQRAAASIAFLGVAARLVAPALGGAALLGSVPDPDPAGVRWQPLLGGPLPLAWLDLRWTAVASTEDAAEALRVGVLDRLVGPLAAVHSDVFRLSSQVLWGNVASGLAGAAQMLVAAGLPLRLDPVAVTAAALEAGPLAGAGAYTDGRFRRNNCCLFYRIPGGGTCADCVLDAPPQPSPSPA